MLLDGWIVLVLGYDSVIGQLMNMKVVRRRGHILRWSLRWILLLIVLGL